MTLHAQFVDGSPAAGQVRLDAAAPHIYSGVQLLATDPTRPEISAQIGDSASGWFGVWVAGNTTTPVMRVFRNGNLVLGSSDTGTWARLQVHAPNAVGSSGPSAYRGLLLTNDVDSTIVLRTLGGGHVQIATDSPGRYLSFATGAFSEAMRIHPNGNITIGATNHLGRLASVSTADSGRAIYGLQASTVESNTTQNDYGLFVDASSAIAAGMTNNGALNGSYVTALNNGPGSVYATLGGRFFSGNAANTSGTVTNAYGVHVQVMRAGGTVVNGYGLYINDVEATTDYGVYQAGTNDTNYFAGNVGIGIAQPAAGNALEVVGNANFTGTVTGGNIQAKYQDLAEWVPATGDLEPGTVVVINPGADNEVTPSTRAYDTTVAGVVSERPGLILGEAAETKETIATTGRVRVRVDARAAPIAVGDLLVTSNRPGVAMKSMPIDVGGVAIHRPGTIVGKALQPLQSGEGEILVLLSLQ